MRFDVLTIFPGMFSHVLGESIIGRAVKNGVIDINIVNIRDHSKDKHRKTDDYPYGGGTGMVMTPQPIYDAWLCARGASRAAGVCGCGCGCGSSGEPAAVSGDPGAASGDPDVCGGDPCAAPGEPDAANSEPAAVSGDPDVCGGDPCAAPGEPDAANSEPAAAGGEREPRGPARPKTVYLSPQGAPLTQKKALELAREEWLILLCGHYEGVDERVLELIADEEISIGDYVLTGGELPAMVLIDCVCRLVPGVLPSEDAYSNESHFDGLLEFPQYTRPYGFMGKTVPDVLLSGHHRNIEAWRREQSIERTRKKRPDLPAPGQGEAR